MAEWNPYSLPDGATRLTAAVEGGGRIVARGEPDEVFVWTLDEGWSRLEGVNVSVRALFALENAVAVMTEPPRRVGLWWKGAGAPSWWAPASGVNPSSIEAGGRYVVMTIDGGTGRALVVLEATGAGWVGAASLPFPADEEICLVGDLGHGLEVVTGKGTWFVGPGPEGWEAHRGLAWSWEVPAYASWHRADGHIVIQSPGEGIRVVDRANGGLDSRGVRLVAGGRGPLEAYLTGDRESLRRHVDFLARLPRSWGRRAAPEVLLLSGPAGPIAAVTAFGVVRADSDGLARIPVWEGPSEVFVLEPGSLTGWRLAAWPEETLPDASGQLAESLHEDLARGLYEQFGEGAIGAVLRSLRGGSPPAEIPREGALARLVALCGDGAARDARDGLESEATNTLVVALAALRFAAEADRAGREVPQGRLRERLVALLDHMAPAVRKEALLATGELRAEALRPVVETRLSDREGAVRSAAIEALLRLDPSNEGAVSVAGAMSRQDLDASVRREAVSQLADIAETNGIREVVAALRDPDADVRTAAGNGVVALASGLDETQFLEAADAALLDVIVTAVAGTPSGSMSLDLADLPERIENVLSRSTDEADARTVATLPGALRRNRLRAALLRALLVRLFGRGLDFARSVTSENDRLRALLTDEPGDGMRGLAFTEHEAAELEKKAWSRHDLARFCLRIREIDPELSDRIALLVPLLHRPSAAVPGAGAPGTSLAARLRAVGEGRSAVDVVLGRVRALAGSGESLSPLAAMALQNLDGALETGARTRRWVRQGRWMARPAALAHFVLLLDEEEACDLLAEAICDPCWPLSSRCKVERAVAGRRLVPGRAARFLPYLEEIVAFEKLPPSERQPYVWDAENEVQETVRKAYLAARVAEGGLTPEDEAVGPPADTEEESEPPF